MYAYVYIYAYVVKLVKDSFELYVNS